MLGATQQAPQAAGLHEQTGGEETGAGLRCPICGQAMRPSDVRGYDRLITGDGPFAVMECARCDYGVTLPQLGDADMARYYPPRYFDFWGYSGRAAQSPLQRQLTRFRSWSAARSYERPPYRIGVVAAGRMLDVGCGSGDLLEHFAKKGWEVYGIDPSASAIAAAAARGAHVHQGTLDDQPWPERSFALITFQHALEHVPDPLAALARARALLQPGGLLAVDVPNWSCWQRRLLFGSRWHPLELPRHLQHFSPRALARIADGLGLRIKELGTTSSVPVVAYSLHYALFGHLRPGWRLWLSYALGMLAFPLVLIGDRLGGGDSCYIVMEAPRETPSHPRAGEGAGT
jgi:SAM-dependent methyltransferase